MSPKGFFNDEEFIKPTTAVAEENCNKCGLYKTCKHPKMAVSGDGEKSILIVAEAPGADEDYKGTQLIGQAGSLLRTKLTKYGIDLDKDCWKTNSLICRPPGNRTPTNKEIAYCRPNLEETIKQLKPEYIWLFGGSAIDSFYLGVWKNRTLESWVGLTSPDSKYDCYVSCLFHPSYILRNSGNKNLESEFDRQIEKAGSYLDKDFIKEPKFSIQVLKKYDDVIDTLNDIHENFQSVAIDFETTGLKPFNEGHYIATVSLATPVHAYAFPFMLPGHFSKNQQGNIRKALSSLFMDDSIDKIGQNIKYEDNWSRRFISPINGWAWDTMLAAHIIDNRPKFTGLKFQAYHNYGIYPYNTKVDKFLTPKNGEFNQIHLADLDELLYYNAMDTAITMKLAEDQFVLMEKEDLLTPIYFFMDSIQTLSDIQMRGFPTSMNVLFSHKEKCEEKIKDIQGKIDSSDEAKKFFDYAGEPFNHASPKHLGILLYDILKHPKQTTEKGNYSVDKTALEKVDSQLVKDILELRKFEKIVGTYIAQVEREVSDDGKVHPIYDIHIPRTYRSSSNNPNWQNLPIRTEEGKELRKSFVAPQGTRIVECDYSGIEVCISACYNKDPNLIKYITDPSTDMHRDTAADIWQLPIKEVSKSIRFYSKSFWVFPQFYGDYYVACARNLWSNCLDLETVSGVKIRDHLAKKGIYTLNQFTEHCKECERIFWYERFNVYREWKEKENQFYIENGYTKSYLGFRFTGYMEPKKVSNYEIQGCLQAGCLIQTDKGWIPIKSIIDSKKVVSIWTGFNWAQAYAVNRGPCQLAEVELDSGLTIKCDTRHKFKNENDDWISFDELKEGNFIALPEISERIYPDEEKVDWFFVLGFLIGDGCYYERMSNDNPLNMRKILSLAVGPRKKKEIEAIYRFFKKELLPANIYYGKYRTGTEKISITVEGPLLVEKLRELKYPCKMNAHTKRIPKTVWTASKEQQISFLHGLWRSDGARLKHQKYNLHMCNLELLKEVQILSYSLGYDSFIRETKNGFILRYINVEEKNHSTRKYPIKILREKIDFSKYPLDWDNMEYIVDKRVFNEQKDINHVLARRIKEKTKSEFDFYRFDKVKAIKILDVIEETYTMSVDDERHQFVADGVICRNTAYHIMQNTLNQINQTLKEDGWKSYVIGQIHDSMIFIAYEEELNDLLKLVQSVGVDKTMKDFPWIIVPLKIEFEASPIGGSWYEKQVIEIKGE